MRTILIIILLTVSVLTLSFFTLNYLNNSTEQMLKEVEKAEEYLENRDWEKAQKQLTRFDTEWNRTQKRWTVFLDHQEIDQIDLALTRLQSFTKACDYSQALAELAALKLLLAHIPEKETFTLHNVF